MEIKLYKFNGKNNEINKVLDNGTAQTLDGVFYEVFNHINPSFKVRAKQGLTDLSSFNYCYITALNRYYFITDIDILSTDVIKLSLHIDVLKSFANEIKAATVTVISRENANGYISNRETVTDSRPQFEKIDFSVISPFVEQGDIILTTTKGNI